MPKKIKEFGPAIMAKWANENLKRGQLYAKSEIIARYRADYPDHRLSSVDARVRGMCVNADHRPKAEPGNGRDLFFKEKDSGLIRLWEPDSDPPPRYRTDLESKSASTHDDSEEYESTVAEDEQVGEAFALEKDLQIYLARNLDRLESGLKLYEGKSGIEFPAGNRRRIDILAVDKDGTFVVIELKASRGYERVIGQLMRYMGWVKTNLAEGRAVRGMVVCSEITQDLVLATSDIADRVKLFEYSLIFNINQKER